MIDIYIKLTAAIVSTYALIIMNFAIFKIPIKNNDKQIAIIALVLGTTNFYLKFIADSDQFFLIQTIMYIVMITIMRRYPILYSVAICIIGSILISLIDVVVTLTAIKLNFTTMEQSNNNQTHFIILHTIVTMIYLLIAFISVKYKIGFSFVRLRFSGKYSIKSTNFIWAGVLILGVAFLQLGSKNEAYYDLNNYLVIFTVCAFLTSIIFAYIQNKKSLIDRFGDERKGE
jgi:hypothetical protein